MCRHSVFLVISIEIKIMQHRASICPALIPFRKLKLFPFPQCRRLQTQDLLAHFPRLDSILIWLTSSLFYRPMPGTMAMLSLVIVQLPKRLLGCAQKVASITTKTRLKMYTKLSVVAILEQQKLAVHSGCGRRLMRSLVFGRR